jgi:hypothetical protein
VGILAAVDLVDSAAVAAVEEEPPAGGEHEVDVGEAKE